MTGNKKPAGDRSPRAALIKSCAADFNYRNHKKEVKEIVVAADLRIVAFVNCLWIMTNLNALAGITRLAVFDE
jgi:hypothetical protein